MWKIKRLLSEREDDAETKAVRKTGKIQTDVVEFGSSDEILINHSL